MLVADRAVVLAGRPDRRGRPSRRADRGRRRRSPSCSARRRSRRKAGTDCRACGATRTGAGAACSVLLLAAGARSRRTGRSAGTSSATRSTTASAQVTSSDCSVDVLAYVAVSARRLAARDDDLADARRHRPAHGARAASRPVRASHLALPALLLGAEGRLDHRPADERRRRAVRRAQPGPDDARRQHADARRSDRRTVPARLASRARGAARAAAGHPRHEVVPEALARGVLGRADAHRRGHGAARRVGRRDGGRPGVQPRAGIPARVRGAERGEPRREHLRAEAVIGLLPRDRAARRDRTGGGAVRGRPADRRRLARDRHADRGGRDAPARVPAAAGALRALRPGAGRHRCDGEDLDRARRRARHHRPAGRTADSARSTDGSTSTASSSPTATSRSSTGSTSTSPRAAASRWSASRAAASRRPRSSSRASTTRPGRRAGRRHRPAGRPTALATAASSGSSCRTRSSSAGRSRTTSASAARMPPTRRSSRRRTRSASTGSPPASRRVSTTSSARAARASRRASAS